MDYENNGCRILMCDYESPCGKLKLGAFKDMLCLCVWMSGKAHERIYSRLRRELNAEFTNGISECLSNTISQLDEYFAGTRRRFDIPLLFIGTEFQKSVWRKLMDVPYGTTESYSAFARSLGIPTAVRAVANANGANPISIFAPCHRIIGSNGSLTGYGGGLSAKKFLLELESTHNKKL